MKRIRKHVIALLIITVFNSCGGNKGGTPESSIDDGQSSDYFIKSLTFSAGTLRYPFNSSDWINYLEVPYDVDSITVTAEANQKWAELYIGDEKLESNCASSPINLNIGSNTIIIRVAAEDGSIFLYTIYITRCSENFSTALLSELTVDGSSLNPVFDPAGSNRNFSVITVLSYISLHAVPSAESEGASASVTVNNADVDNPSSISLESGLNTIVITSTAPDGITIETYTITVVRQTTDSSTKLLKLSIAGGDFNETFDPATYGYSIDVSSSMNPMNITALTQSSNASVSVTVNGTPAADISSVQIPTGLNTVIVKVTNGGASSNYTISANSLLGSDNADLAKITILCGTKSTRPIYPGTFTRGTAYHDPGITAFSTDIYEYVSVVYGFNTVKLTATAEDNTVKGIQFTAGEEVVASTLSSGIATAVIPLTKGEVTKVSIAVLAGDNSTKKIYTVYVKLLNIDEFFWGIYAPSFDKSKNSWTKPQPGSFSRNGYVSGKIDWNVTLAPVSTIKLTNYNDGKMDYMYNDGGFVANGTQECVMDGISTKNGINLTKNPPFDLKTPEGENVATLNYHLVVKKGDPAEAADSYTEITYMGETHRQTYKLTRPYPFTGTYDWSGWSDGL